MSAKPAAPKAQLPSPSRSPIATRFTSAATANASTIAIRPSTTAVETLAATMRERIGSRVKVTNPVRCVHSLVTRRIPSTGSRMACGIPAAATKVS